MTTIQQHFLSCTDRGEFDPHGQVVLETGTPSLNSHKFTGYERDQATSLDYAGARMYSAQQRRFMKPDPSGFDAAAPARPQSLNLYTYVQNDPVNNIDPSGQVTIETHCEYTPWYWVNNPGENAGGYFERWIVCRQVRSDGSLGEVDKEYREWRKPKGAKAVLAKTLRNLPQACVDALGGEQKIEQWITTAIGNAIRFSSWNSREEVYNVPVGWIWWPRVDQWWDSFTAGSGAIAGTIRYPRLEILGGGITSTREHNHIVLGPAFYDPASFPNTHAMNLFNRYGQDLDRYQGAVLLHEFLHWESNGTHAEIADKLNLRGRGYSYKDEGSASDAIDDFFASGCQNKPPNRGRP